MHFITRSSFNCLLNDAERCFCCLFSGPRSAVERDEHCRVEAVADADVNGIGEMSNDPTAAGVVAARSQVPAPRAGERTDSSSAHAVPCTSLPDDERCSQTYGRLFAWQGLQRSVRFSRWIVCNKWRIKLGLLISVVLANRLSIVEIRI